MSTKKGFTLIELLVVIAIIGILSSVVLASLNSAREKSRDSRRISDQSQVRIALELYFDSNGGYPTATSSLVPEYMPSYPTDPGSNDYDYTGSSTGYCVGANLEDDSHSALANTSGGCAETLATAPGGVPDYVLGTY